MPKKCTAANKKNPAQDTLLVIWSIIVWNLKYAFLGIHPREDHMGTKWPAGSVRANKAGKPIHNGFRLWLFGINPDLEAMQNVLWVQAHSFDDMCWLCPANKSTIPFNDARPGAKWRAQKYCVEYTRQHPASTHPIMEIPGVVTQTFCLDTLHTNDLGVLFNFIGNVFFDMVYLKFLSGKTVADRLSNLWSSIVKIYEQLGTSSSNRLGKLTLNNFCESKSPHMHYPTLSGMKARVGRYLLPVANVLCQESLKRAPTAYTKTVALASMWLCKSYDVMESSAKRGLHPNAIEKFEFREATENFMLMYYALATKAEQSGEYKWNEKPKFHYSSHMPDQFDYFNITFWSTYAAETMVGLITSLGHRCLDGTPPHKISYKLAWKYRYAQHLRFGSISVVLATYELLLIRSCDAFRVLLMSCTMKVRLD